MHAAHVVTLADGDAGHDAAIEQAGLQRVADEVQLTAEHVGDDVILIHFTARRGLVVNKRGLARGAGHRHFPIAGIYRSVGIDAVHVEGDIRFTVRHVAKFPINLDFIGNVDVLRQVDRNHRDGVGLDGSRIDGQGSIGARWNLQGAPRVLELENLVAVILVVFQPVFGIIDEVS